MVTAITPDILKEKSFQTLIKEYLTNKNGYVESFNDGYDQGYALDTDCLFSFLETTQKKQMDKLKGIYKANYRSKVLSNINKELAARGSIDVLKHGVKDFGVKLELAYFKPPTTLNPEQFALYQQNILSVTEELVYLNGKRIDLVIFLNGIPVITMELKNPFTGQDYRHAIKQYKSDRSGKEQLFKFKERVIVNFAVDTDEVYMATKLNGDKTFFLPFNKGVGDGAGNPAVEDKLKTHYLWEDILQKDSILEIIHRFTYIERKEEILANGETVTKETMIFPRYHQFRCVNRIVRHAKEFGAGQTYLVQHSAGSGKRNSIAWTAHRLASLHDDANNLIFNGIIVVTDRRVLDQQLQNTIYQLEHKVGLVAKIDEDSNQLARELEKGTRIIISTIQKFPFILSKLGGTKGKKYAVIIDEAHSSTSGENIKALKESLSLEEAAELAMQEEAEEIDAEDIINQQLEDYTNRDNVSFFAFTATPKGTTLRLFGTQQADGSYSPFDTYSMRQAIEEKFILDVLKNYMTYKMFYKVTKKIEEDPAFEKGKAARSIARYVSLHPHNISQKTEIIIEHFRHSVYYKIGGQAKAMLVTSSRQHAVRYKLAFDEYIKRMGYTDLKTLVAFSGTVKDQGIEYREPTMNKGISEAGLPKEFDKDESRVLIVANKYQTGFDQPKLQTMYVDKKLSGVKAVQTLSRLNRIHAGKEDTFVLDFVNDPEDIKESFAPFYRVTTLGNDIEPNELYTIERTIYDRQVINKDDVVEFANRFYKSKHTHQDQSIMDACVNRSIERMAYFTREETLDFKSMIVKFMNLYSLIIQVAPLVDPDLHRLSIYLRFLIKKIEIEDTGGIDLTDNVILEYYRLEKQTEGSILLEDAEDSPLSINVSGQGSAAEDEKDLLSEIIARLNEKYGTEFDESEKLALEQIRNDLQADDDLRLKARANTYEVFKHAFEPAFESNVVSVFDKNRSFFGRILEDEDFRLSLMNLLMLEAYNSFRGSEAIGQ